MINEIQEVRPADLMFSDLNFYKKSSLMYVCNKYWQPKHIAPSFPLCSSRFYLIHLRSQFGSATLDSKRKDLYFLGGFGGHRKVFQKTSLTGRKPVIRLQLSLTFNSRTDKPHITDEGV